MPRKKKPKIYTDPIYKPNKKYKLNDWLPLPDKQTTEIKSNSWFDINKFDNPNPIKTGRIEVIAPIISKESIADQNKRNKKKKIEKEPEFFYCEKIRIYPNEIQINILHQWFGLFQDMFNATIKHVRKIIFYHKQLIPLKDAYKAVNFMETRKALMKEKKEIQNKMDNNKIPIHILDEAIAQACSNYKTCLTLLMEGHIKKFRVREWSIEKRRKIIKIEPSFFKGKINSKSNIFPFKLKSSSSLNMIDKTCTLQYSQDTGKYILFVPRGKQQQITNAPNLDCGIDLGVRTFATVYSQNNTVSICNGAGDNKLVRKYQHKIDKIHELLNTDKKIVSIIVKIKQYDGSFIEEFRDKVIKRSRLRKALRKYHMKITNLVRDLHFKTAHYLVHHYNNIHIGKLSTMKILSRNNRCISKKTKRTIGVLSPYAFRQRLIYMGAKYGANVVEVNEYLTTKTCSNCGKINELGAKKIHNCPKCKMLADRDENAAKNILKVGYETID